MAENKLSILSKINDPRQFYYERVKDVGGIENFMNDVETYLALGGDEA